MITQPYHLNLIPGGSPVRVHVSQYDVGSRDITFALYYGGTAFSVPAEAVVTCDGVKPDRKGFSYMVTASGNHVTVTVTEQMTAVPGKVECQITVRKDGKVLGSANFLLVVERAALPDGADISETEINAFTQIANQAAEAAQSTQEAVETLDGKKAALDETTKAANTANTNLTAATKTANTTRTDLVSATNAGNTARGNLEKATDDANDAKDALSQPTADARAAKTALDTANQTAADNLEALNNSAAMAQKIPKISPAVEGNLATLKADGTLSDSGKKPGDFAQSGLITKEIVVNTDAEIDAAIKNVYSDMADETSRLYVLWVDKTGTSLYGGGHVELVNRMSDDYGTIIDIRHGSTGPIIMTRAMYGGALTPWEWVNPLMQSGVEYRTTERFFGYPVYVKAVDIGALPNASTKLVGFSDTPAAVLSLDLAISDGSVLSAGTGYDRMWSLTYPIIVSNTTYSISVGTQTDMSSLTARAFVKYYK